MVALPAELLMKIAMEVEISSLNALRVACKALREAADCASLERIDERIPSLRNTLLDMLIEVFPELINPHDTIDDVSALQHLPFACECLPPRTTQVDLFELAD